MTNAIDNTTRPVSFIRFHGLTLLVVENLGVEYTEAKPLTDLCGMDWKSAKRTLKTPDNEVLYGTKVLSAPRIGGAGGDITPQNEVIFLRLDRARIFLARVSTDRMRSHGNVDAAEQLLALQIEWAEALHAYETNGIAVKKGHKDGLSELTGLYKVRALAESAGERTALTALIRDAFEGLGYPLPSDSQQSLPLAP